MSRFAPTRTALVSAALVSSCLGLAVGLDATQDPIIVSPEAYRLEFENAWVKVVRVQYEPKAVVAPHFHTARASAYVYLNDGGPILFRHEGLPYAAVTRPATKAGSFRVYKGIDEVHAVENPTAIVSDFLRVEFKTDPVDEASLKGKFFREEPAPAVTAQRTQFENAQVRITRVRVAAGDSVNLVSMGDQPTLLVALTSTGIARGGSAARFLQTGKTAWLEGGETARVQSTATAGEVLRFDFKSRPLESR